MFRVVTCLATEHDFRLVLLAAVICAMAAFTSFRIYARATSARAMQDHQYRRLAWLGLTGISTGAGIWSTHFVAMLAYDSGFPTAYDPTLTLASLVIAIGVTTTGYLMSVDGKDFTRAQRRLHAGALGNLLAAYGADARVAVGGAVVGAGIGMMHYTGMAAVIVPGTLEWNTPHVVASVVLGMALASAAMVVNRRLDPRTALWVAPGLLTLAICSLHFTAMAAATVVPDPTIVVLPSVMNTVGMAFAVAGVTMLVMLAAVGAALVNAQAERDVEKELRRHNEILQQRDKELEAQNAQLAQQHALLKQHEEQLQAQNLHLDAALNNMVQGLAMFDPGHRLVVANARYAEMYGLTPEEVDAGHHPEADPRAPHRQGLPCRQQRRRGARIDAQPHARQNGRAIHQLAARWALHYRVGAADGGRRHGHHASRHHRAAPLRGQDCAHGAARRADRLAQPRAAQRAARVRVGARQGQRDRSRASSRPRSLQERQRYAGPSGRR